MLSRVHRDCKRSEILTRRARGIHALKHKGVGLGKTNTSPARSKNNSKRKNINVCGQTKSNHERQEILKLTILTENMQKANLTKPGKLVD